MRSLLVVLLLAGCFADETQLSGGAVCQSGAGWFCGFDGVPGMSAHLYYCPLDGRSAAIDIGACPDGTCSSGTPGSDHCQGGVSRSTAFGYPGYGWWCGEAFSGGAPGHLYFFDDNFGADLGLCPNGCKIEKVNVADHCL